jgi:hypothetical protein
MELDGAYQSRVDLSRPSCDSYLLPLKVGVSRRLTVV